MRRISLITESATRKDHPMPAHLFYQSNRSSWVNKIIEYVTIKEVNPLDIFFLSFHEQKIIPFNHIVQPYPKSSKQPTTNEKKLFSQKIFNFLRDMNDDLFVEIHASKEKFIHLISLLDAHGIEHKIYADGEPLARKPKKYEEYIQNELNQRRLKQIQKEKWTMVSELEYKTPQEAQKLVDLYEANAELYRIETELSDVVYSLKKYNQRNKEAQKALLEYENEASCIEVNEFLRQHQTMAKLFSNLDKLEKVKSSYGKAVAKYIRYLIKRECVLQIEDDIKRALLRVQIALLKS